MKLSCDWQINRLISLIDGIISDFVHDDWLIRIIDLPIIWVEKNFNRLIPTLVTTKGCCKGIFTSFAPADEMRSRALSLSANEMEHVEFDVETGMATEFTNIYIYIYISQGYIIIYPWQNVSSSPSHILAFSRKAPADDLHFSRLGEMKIPPTGFRASENLHKSFMNR